MTTRRAHAPARAPTLLLVFMAGLLGACSSPTDGGDHARDVAIIQVVAGGQTVNITRGGAQGSLNIPLGTTPVTAVLLRANGEALTLDDTQFEIRMNSNNAGVVTFSRTGAFAGTLAGVEEGFAIMQVSLFHISGNHDDFGPHPLGVNVEEGQ